MKRRGTGYDYEILAGVFFLILILTFFAKDSHAIVPPIMLVMGVVMIVGGMATREPMIITGGLVVLAFALMFSEVFVK